MNSYPPPKDEKEFERLCFDFLRRDWNRPGLILYAKRGEKQHGVDIVDQTTPQDVVAAQCKLHESTKSLEPAAIQAEVAKADTFPQRIARYAICTTARRSKGAIDAVLALNAEREPNRLFLVELVFWDEIEIRFDTDDEFRETHLRATHLSVRGVVNDQLTALLANTALHALLGQGMADSALATAVDRELATCKRLLDEGKHEAAEAILVDLRGTAFDRLTPLQRFRCLTNLGVIKIRRGEESEGGRLLLDAVASYPEHEHSLLNRAHGEAMVGRLEEAWSAVRAAREKCPTNSDVIAAYICYAPATVSIDSLLAELAEFTNAPAALLAFADRAVARCDYSRALEFLDRIRDCGRETSYSQFLRGAAVAGLSLPEDPRERPDDPALVSNLRFAVDCLEKAVQQAQVDGDRRIVVQASLLQVDIAGRTGDDERRDRAIDQGLLNTADNTEARGRFAVARSQACIDQGLYDRAVTHAEGAVRCLCADPDAHALLAAALWNRNIGHDRELSRREFRKRLCDFSSSTLEQVAAVLIPDAIASKSFNDAEAILMRLESAGLDVAALRAFQSIAAGACDGNDAAIRLADEAADAMSAASSRSTRRLVAQALGRVGSHARAAETLKPLASKTLLSDDTREFLRVASLAGGHDVLLEWYGALWDCGALDSRLEWAFLNLSEQYAASDALRRIDERLCTNDDVVSAAILKTRRVLLDHRTGHPLRAVRIDDVLPVEKTEAHVVPVTVEALRLSEQHCDAVQYAYRSTLRFPDDAQVHASLIRAVLFAPEGRLDIAFTEVGAGCAVEFCEPGGGRSSWRIIEAAAAPGSADVVSETAPLARALIGGSVGDEVVLAHGIAGPRTATILSIQPAWQYRFNELLEQWQIRFPDVPLIEQCRMRSDPITGELDTTALVAILKTHAEHVHRVAQIYASGAVPIALLAQRVGRGVFGTMAYLASEDGLFVNCAIGTDDGVSDALRTLRGAKGFILDDTALWTLRQLGLADVVQMIPVPLGTVQQNLDAVRAEAPSGVLRRERRHVRLDSDRIAFLEESEDDAERTRVGWERMAELLASRSQYSSAALAALPAKTRDDIVLFASSATAHAMAAAQAVGFAIWSDDRVVEFLAKQYFGVPRVWTQAVLAWLCEQGALDRRRYHEASAHLQALQFSGTWTDEHVVLAGARRAGWKVDERFFSRNVRILAGTSTHPLACARIAMALIRGCVTDLHLTVNRTNVLVAIAEQLKRRDPSLRLVHRVLRLVPAEFAVNPIAAQDIVATLSAWLASQALVIRGRS